MARRGSERGSLATDHDGRTDVERAGLVKCRSGRPGGRRSRRPSRRSRAERSPPRAGRRRGSRGRRASRPRFPASGSSARAASPASLIVDALNVQGRRTRDDDEEADHTCQQCADDDVGALVPQVFDVQPLVDRVGLDEGEAPWRQRRADGRHCHQQRRRGSAEGPARRGPSRRRPSPDARGHPR